MIVARKDAKESGQRFYFTGKPCARGHVAKRYVVSSVCVDCVAPYRDNPERKKAIAKQAKAWRERNPEYLYLAKKNQRLSNVERHNERNRNSYAKNRTATIERTSRYRKANPDKVKTHKMNRRAKERSCEGTHNDNDIKAIWEKQNGLCNYCSADLAIAFDVDHRMPLALGGTNFPTNLQLLCPSCNRSKGAKHPEVYERLIGYNQTSPD